MELSFNEMIKRLGEAQPDWIILLGNGYAQNRHSGGREFFCHLMHKDFAKTDDPAPHSEGWGDTAEEAFNKAIGGLLEESDNDLD